MQIKHFTDLRFSLRNIVFNNACYFEFNYLIKYFFGYLDTVTENTWAETITLHLRFVSQQNELAKNDL